MADHEHGSPRVESREGVITETHGQSGSSGRGVMGAGGFFRGISWSALFSGALVALMVMVLLNLLGVAIGAATMEVGIEQSGLGVGAGIWWGLSLLIGLFAGGWVAGRLSTSIDRGEGILHGVVTWSLFLFGSLLLLGTVAGQMLGGAFSFLSQNLSAMIQQNEVVQQVEAMIGETTVTQDTLTDAQAQATIAAQQATDALAAGATWAFIALLLGLVVCALGSLLGASMPPEYGEARSERARRVFTPRPA